MLAWMSKPENIALVLSIALAILTVLKLFLPAGPLYGRIPISQKATADLMLVAGFFVGFTGALSAGQSMLGALLVGLGGLGGSGAALARKAHGDANAQPANDNAMAQKDAA